MLARLARARVIALVRALIFLLLAIAMTPSPGKTQTQVTLTLTGGPVSFATPTASDFTVGGLEAATPLTYQAQTIEEPPIGTHTTTVYIRSSSATLGGGKPVGDLEWRRGDDLTWRSLTTTNAAVESRTTSYDVLGHTFSNTVHFRVALRWTTDAPATYTGNLVFTEAVTQP